MPPDVEKMLMDYVGAWNSGDPEKVASFLTDDCVFESLPGEAVHRGLEEVQAWATGVFASFPDFKLEIKSLFVAGDWVGVEWIETGTHKGAMGPHPPTGKSFAVPGASIIELHQGKIKRETLYWDSATFLRQLGLMPDAHSR
jgi:steroid delta-isomerase-like uncharacterized protein